MGLNWADGLSGRPANLIVATRQSNCRLIDELLLRSLQDPDEVAEYLTACYEDSRPVFLQGLRMVVEAHGGVAELAKRQTS